MLMNKKHLQSFVERKHIQRQVFIIITNKMVFNILIVNRPICKSEHGQEVCIRHIRRHHIVSIGLSVCVLTNISIE